MYLFKNKDFIEVPYRCKVCSKEITFKITAEEYKNNLKFPMKKEMIHGEPEHNLIIFLNQYLEVENFEIKEIFKKEDVSFSRELTRQVLTEIELTDDEIELYFLLTGREAVSIGEMAILIGKPKQDCEKIAKKFVDKGLFKEIIGDQPHYTALPPYAALISQLQKFRTYITDIKDQIPKQLEQSFAKFDTDAEKVEAPPTAGPSADMMKELKDTMLSQIKDQKKEFDETLAVMDQIKGITQDISSLEGVTENIMGVQLGDISQQFQDINNKTSQIIKNQISELRTEFDGIKTTVSSNLQKLRLGVIQQTVEQVIEKVVNARLKEITDNINVQLSVNQMAFADEIKKVSDGMNTEIIGKIKESLTSTIESIDGIAAKSQEDKEQLYDSITENFNKAVEMAEKKIEGISGGVFESFGNLKDAFSTQIVSTLNNTLDDVLNKLETSEKVTNEFWDQARKGTFFTMKDIWFIRSIESAKAHITDEIGKAKMRVLIVAPQITDIDVEAIKNRPPRINFRIATYIDLSNPEHQAIISKLDAMDNVDYRHRTLQNLWGINRDYENVILCVLSATEIRGDLVTEIAGIGSIIEEHIKIFVPILEEAWMSSRKEIVHSIKTTIVKDSDTEPSPEPEPIKPVEQKPEVPPPEKKEPVLEEPLEVPPSPAPPSPETKALLGKQFDLIFDSVETSTGLQIANALEKFQSEYINKEGYNSVLKNVHNTSLGLKNKTYVLSQPEKEDLKMKMKFWKQKLNFE